MFRFVLAAVAAAFLSSATPSLAADVSAYGRLPAIEDVTLSPSGARLAYVSTSGDQRHLVVLDLPDKTLVNVPVGQTKIAGVDWAGNDHLILTILNTRSNDFYYFGHDEAQVLSINLNTKKTVPIFVNDPMLYHAVFGQYGLAQIDGHWFGYFGGITLEKSRGVDPTAGTFEATLGHGFTDLYRVDLDTGTGVIMVHGNLLDHNWIVDSAGALTAFSSYDDAKGGWELHDGGVNHALVTKIQDPLGEVALEGLGRTPGSVVIHNSQPEEWTLSDGTHHPLPLEAGRAVDGVLHDPVTGLTVGVSLLGDARAQQFFDPKLEAKYQALKKALGSTTVVVSWSSDYKRLVVETEGKGDSGTYWLIDGGQANIIDNPYPDVAPAMVGESQVISYKAGDGLEIHGILTLPPGRQANSLPIVVLPHGGPQDHDSLGFDWFAQAFAVQGYAVFQPNFRGSDGYLDSFRDAGFGEWGRKMQTDISDGLAELVKRGIADPKRACIVGGSYGGYAALAGVTVQQGLYRCAVSLAGISDLNAMLAWEQEHNGFAPSSETRYWRKFMGVTSNGDPALQSVSPVRLAGRADAPILLIHGTDDTTVPIEQSQMMEKALRGAGKPVDLIVMKDEDHHLSREAGRKAFISAAVDFVIKHNPPDPAPAVAASATAPGSSN